MSPGQCVLDALPARLSSHPQLEVFGSVVHSVAVDVVNVLAGQQGAAELRLHDVPVLQNPAARFQANQPIAVGCQALSGFLVPSRSAGCSTARSGFK